MLDKLLKAMAPVAAIAVAGVLASSTAGCKGDISIDGLDGGVPLDELDMSGDAPESITVAAPVHIFLQTGKTLKVSATGDDDLIEKLRFSNKEGTLAVGMADGRWNSDGKTTVNVTMPAPKVITAAGSGSIDAAQVAKDASVTLAGSGSMTIDKVKSDTLDVNIAGSGNIRAGGTAGTVKLNIVGAGGAEMADLTIQNADITVAGSGSAVLASDGKVKANIVGSGNIRVIGRADCEVLSMGSGSLKCEVPATRTEPKKKSKSKKKPTKKAKD